MLLANSQTVPISEAIGIAVTGMLIVFTALMLIATFITMLPRLLKLVTAVVPPAAEPAAGSSSGDFPIPEPDEDELLATHGTPLNRHFFAIHHDGHDRVELCLSRSEEDLQLILLPLKLFPVFEATVDSDWLRENTGCTRPGRRVLEDLRDFLQRPAACSMVALQIGDAASMVVMNVGGQN